MIAIVAGLLFVPFLGAVRLFDPWETSFAAAAREMIARGSYSIVRLNFQPAYDKFPLFVWMQAGSMSLFGINEFAARLPNALTGVVTLLTLYAIGKKQADANQGIWWALVYAGSWLPHIWFRSGLPDPIFNSLVFLSVYFTYRIGYTVKPDRMAVLSGLCLGLAVLVKGPAAILISLLTLLAYWVASKGKTAIRFRHVCFILLIACLPLGLWLLVAGFTQGWAFAGNFCRYQVGLLREAWPYNTFYYWALLPGCFPACVFLFSYLQARRRRSVYATPQPLDIKELNVWMWSLCWVILLTGASSLYFLPLSYLGARQVYRIAEGRLALRTWNTILLLLVGLMIGVALTLLPVAGVYKDLLATNTGNPLLRTWLAANVPWSLWETIYGLLYLLIVIISTTLLSRQKYQNGLLLLFFGTALTVSVALYHFAPKIEAHTQTQASVFYRLEKK